MSFTRTPSGLSNLRYFLNVDGVVYVEGGDSYTADQIFSGTYNSESADIHFWRTVFENCKSRLRLCFRAAGSKTTLEEIARLIASGSISGVLVAMDRDYDRVFGKTIASPQVMYTYGYSWESDVWIPLLLEKLFYSVTGSDPASAKVVGELSRIYRDFYRQLRHAIHADMICNAHFIEFLPKSKPLKLVRFKPSREPFLSRSEIRSCFEEAKKKRSTKMRSPVKACDPVSDCHGHLAAEFGYLVLVYLMRKYSKPSSMPKSLLNHWAIDHFGAILRLAPSLPVTKHYKSQVRPTVRSLK